MNNRNASNPPASHAASGIKVGALVFALATIAIAADIVWMMPAKTPRPQQSVAQVIPVAPSEQAAEEALRSAVLAREQQSAAGSRLATF